MYRGADRVGMCERTDFLPSYPLSSAELVLITSRVRNRVRLLAHKHKRNTRALFRWLKLEKFGTVALFRLYLVIIVQS
jgi:hypothetical protein